MVQMPFPKLNRPLARLQNGMKIPGQLTVFIMGSPTVLVLNGENLLKTVLNGENLLFL